MLDTSAGKIARRIQNGIVPSTFHERKDGADVCGMMEPAWEVGGDFYDCFLLEEGQYCAVIGDVSGKGVAGALFTARSRPKPSGPIQAGRMY